MSKTSPDVSNYLLGKCVVYFDRFNSAGAQTGEMDLGNTPNFSITPNVESIDHFSSREGLKKKDKSVDTGLGYTAKFAADEFSRDNLNLFLLGDGTEGSETQNAGAVGNEAVTARHDKWVKLTYRSVSNVVITNSTGVTTYTEITDYEIDYATGRIKALSTGSITDAQALLVDYHYASVTYPTIAAGMTSTIEGYLRFIGNPEVGPKYEVEV
jgi:hypothetical protein